MKNKQTTKMITARIHGIVLLSFNKNEEHSCVSCVQK